MHDRSILLDCCSTRMPICSQLLGAEISAVLGRMVSSSLLPEVLHGIYDMYDDALSGARSSKSMRALSKHHSDVTELHSTNGPFPSPLSCTPHDRFRSRNIVHLLNLKPTQSYTPPKKEKFQKKAGCRTTLEIPSHGFSAPRLTQSSQARSTTGRTVALQRPRPLGTRLIPKRELGFAFCGSCDNHI